MADSQIACPWPNCNSQCPACGGSGRVPLLESNDIFPGERFETGFQMIGTGEPAFRRLCLAAFELLQFRKANSCCFTRAYASVCESRAVHSPFLRGSVRKPAQPWVPGVCVNKLWEWLCGVVPNDLELPVLPPRQQYLHVQQAGVVYPESPPWHAGKNEERPPEWRFHRSFMIRNHSFDNVRSLAVFPVWARWGAFSNEEPER